MDTLVRAMDQWMHELMVWWHGGLGIVMPSCARERERGQVRCIEVQGGARVQRWGEGGQGWTKSTISASMGTKMIHVCKVLGQMPSRI